MIAVNTMGTPSLVSVVSGVPNTFAPVRWATGATSEL